MTTVHWSSDLATLWHGDCLEVLREIPDESIDAIVTDPPYGIALMGRQWDQPGEFGSNRVSNNRDPYTIVSPAMEAGRYDLSPHAMRNFQRWVEAWATECLRVLKPGGHIVAFGGARTWHRLASGVEDAGFEIRDSIAWLYAQGFPKSIDVSAAIDKSSGTNRERRLQFTAWMRSTGITSGRINALTGTDMGVHLLTDKKQPAIATADMFDLLRTELPEVPEEIERLVAERTGVEWTDYAKRRITGQHAYSAPGQKWMANHDGDAALPAQPRRDEAHTEAAARWAGWGTNLKPSFEPIVVGRKPLLGTVAATVLAHGTGGINIAANRTVRAEHGQADDDSSRWPTNVVVDERTLEELPRDLDHFPVFKFHSKAPGFERPVIDGVQHPTVKPLGLMRWLVRLVTPPGGTVLEPFAGSGTTLEAAVVEGFHVIGIEREAEYLPLVVHRLTKDHQQTLFADLA